MNRPLLSLILLAATLSVGHLNAQTQPPTPDQASPLRAWEAEFERGHYLVWLNSISSISKHEYVADTAARVVEVNIATNSSVQARFYFLEPVTKQIDSGVLGASQSALEKAKAVVTGVAERVAPGSTDMRVVKNYPTSTHAHTVEFILETEDELNSLYASLTQAVKTGRGRKWEQTGE